MADKITESIIKLSAEVDEYVSDMNRAAKSNDALAKSADDYAKSEDKKTKVTRQGRDELQQMEARYSAKIRLEEKLRNEQEKMQRINAKGIGDEAERARVFSFVEGQLRAQIAALDKQDAAMRKSATSTGLARYEMINLSRQIQDVGVSLAGGQSPFRILVEQGSQIADIFISSKATVKDFFTGIATSIRGLGSGAAALGIGAFVTTLVVGAGAAAVAWASAQKDVELALLGIGRASGATAQSINEIAKAGATTFGLSISEAREFASILAQTGHIGVEQLGSMVAVGKNLATVLGVNSTEAAKILGKALAEPGKGIEQLNQSLGQFDAATVRHVQNLIAQNKLLEAQKILMEGVAQATKNAGDALSNTANFWTALGNKISNAAAIVGEFVAKQTGIGQSSQQALEGLIANYQELQRQMEVVNPALREALQIKADSLLTQIGLISSNMEKVGLTAEETRRKLLSMANQKLVRDVSPEIAQFEKLKNSAEGLANLLQRIAQTGGEGSPLLREMGQTLAQVQLSAARAKEAFASALTPVQRMTAEFELQKASIEARTLSERLAVVERQTLLQLAGQEMDIETKTLAVEQQKTLEITRQAQTHKDNIAALQDQLQVAKARTPEAAAAAQYEADIAARKREGASSMQAEEEAALKRKITEEGIAKTKEAASSAAKAAAEKELDAAEARYELEQKILLLRQRATIGIGQGPFGRLTEDEQSFREKKGLDRIEYNTGGIPLGGPGVNISAISLSRLGDYIAMKTGNTAWAQGQVEDTRARVARAKEAADKQVAAAQMQIDAAQQQMEAAKAARQAQIESLDEAIKDIIASRLLAGQTPQQINALIEAMDPSIRFGTASARFQAQLDLYKRAGMSPAQTAADIRAGLIGEGARPSELLDALDSLTQAVDSNTSAQLGLSDFYTQQGDRLLGYRGYNVQRGVQGAISAGTGGAGTGGTGTGTGTGGIGGMPGAVPNVPGGGIAEEYVPGPAGGGPGAGIVMMTRILNGMIVEGYYNASSQWITTRIISVAPGMTRPPDTPGVPVGSGPGPQSFQRPGSPLPIGSSPNPNYLSPYQQQISGAYRFAEGGIVNRPTMGMVGEAGPEAIIPLRGDEARNRLSRLFVQGSMPEQSLPGLLKAINALLNRLAANENKPTVQVNAPLVNFQAAPTRDEVRESAFQAGQMLRRMAMGGS